MQDFVFYFNIGWKHIISIDALDHLLFIAALSVIYSLKYWKQVLLLATAFTIGHLITLALSISELFTMKSTIIEFLIPLTILSTVIYNLTQPKVNEIRPLLLNYLFAGFFGLIHGLGFAGYIRFMIADAQPIGLPLFAFNIGLEAGQLLIVMTILVLTHLAYTLQMRKKILIKGVSVIIFAIACWMAWERLPVHLNKL